MVPDQTGFSPCVVTDHCISKCSCLNRDFILAVPTLADGGSPVYGESCTWCAHSAVGLCRTAVIVSQVWNLGNILAHRLLLSLSSTWRKGVTNSELLVSWWRWHSPAWAFLKEPLATEQGGELWAVWIVLATCSQPSVLWDDSGPVSREIREQLRAQLLLGAHQFGLYELLWQAIGVFAVYIIRFCLRTHLPCSLKKKKKAKKLF